MGSFGFMFVYCGRELRSWSLKELPTSRKQREMNAVYSPPSLFNETGISAHGNGSTHTISYFPPQLI